MIISTVGIHLTTYTVDVSKNLQEKFMSLLWILAHVHAVHIRPFLPSKDLGMRLGLADAKAEWTCLFWLKNSSMILQDRSSTIHSEDMPSGLVMVAAVRTLCGHHDAWPASHC